VLAALYRVYNRHVIPTVGGWISGRRTAYNYLHDTSTRFPYGREFQAQMEQTGCFSEVTARPLTFGVAWLYCGVVA
jgi:demethylmenaquinone methyltransferase/2-methoxy-6-polyprenyl-1,4-benzoquinol methylase